MKKNMVIIFIMLIFLLGFQFVTNASNFEKLSYQNEISLKHNIKDIFQAEKLAKKFNLSVDTVLQLYPNGYGWEIVETALDKMNTTKYKLKNKEDRKKDSIISALSEHFSDKEILLIVYYATIFEEDIVKMSTKMIKEKKLIKDESSQLTNIDLSSKEQLSPTSTTNTYYEIDYNKSSPFSPLLSNGADLINPQTGYLRVFNQNLVLPGKNGLDLDLSLVYRSNGAFLDSISLYIEQGQYSTFYFNRSNPNNALFNRYNFGVGWSFSFPFLGGNQYSRYLHFNKQSYLIDWDNTVSGLKDVNTKEFVISKYNNVNFPMAAYLLKAKNGVNYYFDENGNLIRIKNRFGDEINFDWGTTSLTRIRDSIGRDINFTYSDSQVIMTINSDSNSYQVKYYKEHIENGLYKLVKVEYPESVCVNYEYTVDTSNFNFLSFQDTPQTRRILLLDKATNPYGGSIVYNYDKHEVPLYWADDSPGYKYIYKISDRYVKSDNLESDHNKYDYVHNDLGETISTQITYYEIVDNVTPAKTVTMEFNDQGENSKTTLIYDNRKEEKEYTYSNGVPDSIDITKTDENGIFVTEEIDIDYDDYGNIVYQKDISGKVQIADYVTINNPTEFNLSCLKTSKELIDGDLYHGVQYEYDNYGNPTVITEQELTMMTTAKTKNLVNPVVTIMENDKNVTKELPIGTEQFSLNVFSKAYAPLAWANFEIRYWQKGNPRPADPYKRYENQAAVFASHESNISLTIDIPDPGERYYVEVLVTAAGLWGSYVQVKEINADYHELVASNVQVKSKTHNYYQKPYVFGLPSKVHKEFGDSGSLHNTDFAVDECIIQEYLYEHDGVDDPYNNEVYSNLWPTKIIQYYNDADGNIQSEVTYNRYNRFGQITQLTKGDIVKKYEFDKLNRLIKEISFGQVNGFTKELHKIYDYSSEADIDGNYTTTISHQDANGNGASKHVTTLYYNQAGQPVKTTKGTGGDEIVIEKITYDGFGRKESVEDGEGIKSVLNYDGISRITKIEQYNQAGEVVSCIQKKYDDIYRKITEEMYSGIILVDKNISYMNKQGNIYRLDDYLTSNTMLTTHYEYNYAGQLKKTIDPRNITLQYSYNYFGVEKVDYPGLIRADDVFEFTFIDSERVIKKLRDNNLIETHLDELDRKKKIIFSSVRELRKYYNYSGLIEEATFNPTNKISYNYDERGQLINVQQNYDGANYSLGYTYDEKGNCTSITYPNGLKVEYNFDQYDRIVRIPGYVEKPGGLPGIEYKNNGFIDSMTYKNGVVTDYVPDNLFRISRIKSSVMDYRYDYDVKNNITNITKYRPDNEEKIYNHKYVYYLTGWLKEDIDLLESKKMVYAYDSAGNRTRLTSYIQSFEPTPPEDPIVIDPPYIPLGVSTLVEDEAIPYKYNSNELNLLTEVDAKNITHDNWGNIIDRADNGHHYTFNESNQLVEVSYGGSILGQYWYNAEGKRYKKVEQDKTTYYIYSGENLLYEVRPDYTICYIYLKGKPIARVETRSDGQATYYYHTDIQGSTRVITDSAANVIENYDYEPFGIPSRDTSNESVAYTTKGQDSTGLYYFNARYYDPSLGRFISEDPAKDGQNWYVFCVNNPLKYNDTNGKEVEIIILGCDENAGLAYRYLGHTALRINNEEVGDVVYSFGRYGEVWGPFGSSGEGILRVYSSAERYIGEYAGEGRQVWGYVMDFNEEQEKNVIKYVQNLIEGKEPSVTQAKEYTRKDFVIDDYQLFSYNCSKLVIDAINANGEWKAHFFKPYHPVYQLGKNLSLQYSDFVREYNDYTIE